MQVVADEPGFETERGIAIATADYECQRQVGLAETFQAVVAADAHLDGRNVGLFEEVQAAKQEYVDHLLVAVRRTLTQAHGPVVGVAGGSAGASFHELFMSADRRLGQASQFARRDGRDRSVDAEVARPHPGGETR